MRSRKCWRRKVNRGVRNSHDREALKEIYDLAEEVRRDHENRAHEYKEEPRRERAEDRFAVSRWTLIRNSTQFHIPTALL